SQGQAIEKIVQQLEILRYNISKWEKELTTLKAKQKVNQASELANQHIANMDTHGTIDMLERMKTKGRDSESMDKAYEPLPQQNAVRAATEIQARDNTVAEELESFKQQIKRW